MALVITLNPDYNNVVIGFDNSALPLGARTDLIDLLKLAYEAGRQDYLAFFDNPPTYQQVMDELGLPIPPRLLSDLLDNANDTFTGTPPVRHIVTCTQAQYDAIVTPDSNTLYFII